MKKFVFFIAVGLAFTALQVATVAADPCMNLETQALNDACYAEHHPAPSGTSEAGGPPTLTLDDAIIELKELLEDGRVKNTFLKRFSNYLYLKPLLDKPTSPLGREIKVNL